MLFATKLDLGNRDVGLLDARQRRVHLRAHARAGADRAAAATRRAALSWIVGHRRVRRRRVRSRTTCSCAPSSASRSARCCAAVAMLACLAVRLRSRRTDGRGRAPGARTSSTSRSSPRTARDLDRSRPLRTLAPREHRTSTRRDDEPPAHRAPALAAPGAPEAVVEERARRRRAGRGRRARAAAARVPHRDRVRVLLPRRERHVLPQRRARRRGRPPASREAQPAGRGRRGERAHRGHLAASCSRVAAIALSFAARWQLSLVDRRVLRAHRSRTACGSSTSRCSTSRAVACGLRAAHDRGRRRGRRDDLAVVPDRRGRRHRCSWSPASAAPRCISSAPAPAATAARSPGTPRRSWATSARSRRASRSSRTACGRSRSRRRSATRCGSSSRSCRSCSASCATRCCSHRATAARPKSSCSPIACCSRSASLWAVCFAHRGARWLTTARCRRRRASEVLTGLGPHRADAARTCGSRAARRRRTHRRAGRRAAAARGVDPARARPQLRRRRAERRRRRRVVHAASTASSRSTSPREPCTVEAGVSIEMLMRVLLPLGWFPMVVPGTRHVTVGGAIASDIHGKFRHGSFADSVERMRSSHPSAARSRVEPDDDATCSGRRAGGMGLTGIVTEATLQLQPVETAHMVVDTERADRRRRLHGADARRRPPTTATPSRGSTASPGGKHLGRSVLTRGNHATLDDLPDAKRAAARDVRAAHAAARAAVDCRTACSTRCRSARSTSCGSARRRASGATHVQAITRSSIPLDGVLDWNRIYGSQRLRAVPVRRAVRRGSASCARCSNGSARSGARRSSRC